MTTSAGRGRPRQAETDQRILDAARELLRDGGPTAVHIEPVSTRSGVARTTIYRRYRDRRALLGATLAAATDQGVPPDEHAPGDKVRWVLARVREVLATGIGRGGVAAVLTDSDPEFTDALRSSLTGYLAPVLDAMASDAALGRIRRDVDPEAVVDLAFGAYLGELLRHGEERPVWLDRTAEMLSRVISAD